MRRSSVYPKSAAAAQEARCDGQDGLLRSQLSLSPQGYCYIKCASPPMPPYEGSLQLCHGSLLVCPTV